MSKIYLNPRNNIVISVDQINANEFVDNSLVIVCWEGFGCGVFFNIETNSTYVFADNASMHHFLNSFWDSWNASSDLKEALTTEGTDGAIETCIAFVAAFAVKMTEMVDKVKAAM